METKSYTATGKTVEIALENAKKALMIDTIDGFGFEILDKGKSGFFGIGATPAKVRVYELEPEKPTAPAQKKEPAPKAEHKQKKSFDKKPAVQKKQETEQPTTAQSKATTEQKAAPTGTPIDENCAALAFVRTTLKNLGLTATADGYVDEEGIKRIIVTGSDATMLIGHHGDTLDAFQYLANLAANREFKSGDKNHNRVTVDIEDYRSKREQTLRALARRMANKAIKYGRSVMLEPMNPYERRIIHSEIQNIGGVATNSIGSENNRKVVIYLTDGKKKNTK